MTVIEAIKSGRPFKRAKWNTYHDAVERTPGYNALTFELADILADDWMIQPKDRRTIKGDISDCQMGELHEMQHYVDIALDEQ